MKSFTIKEEEYNLLSRHTNKKLLSHYELIEEDRIFLASNTKINPYYLDEYLEKKYNNVSRTKNINNATVIIGNENSFYFRVGIGYHYEGNNFRNIDQWRLFIDRINPRKEKTAKKPTLNDSISLLKDSYKDMNHEVILTEDMANKIYYIEIANDDFDVEIIRDYCEDSIITVDEQYLIDLVHEELVVPDKVKYGIKNDDIVFWLKSGNKTNTELVVNEINKLPWKERITHFLPFYYSEFISHDMRNALYNDVFGKINMIKGLLLEPAKAKYSNYSKVAGNIERIQKKTKLEIDKDMFIKSFLNVK